MEKRTFIITRRYLALPLYLGTNYEDLFIWIDDKLYTAFHYPIAAGDPVAYRYLPLVGMTGKRMTIEGPECVAKYAYLAETHEKKNSDLVYHFSSSFGWINDPNGCIMDRGVYHLFFQHNPVGVEWENMSWGHATSKDLIVWQEEDVALLPDDLEHVIFSGSADREGDNLRFLYTKANRSSPLHFTQCLASSTDHGYTLRKEGVAIECINADNRDPKIFYHKGNRYMILWMQGNEFAIFRFHTWKEWKEVTRIQAPEFWECPDFMLLTDEKGREYWVFTEAGGRYVFASFDGEVVHLDDEVHHLFLTPLAYASQSFAASPLIISWLRTKNHSYPSQGTMGLPRALAVANIDGECIVTKNFPPSFASHLGERFEFGGEQIDIPLSPACRIRLVIEGKAEGMIGSVPFAFDQETGEAEVNGKKVVFTHHVNTLDLLLDSFILEISDAQGINLAYYEIPEAGALRLHSSRLLKATYQNVRR